jgi:hypothetical protein
MKPWRSVRSIVFFFWLGLNFVLTSLAWADSSAQPAVSPWQWESSATLPLAGTSARFFDLAVYQENLYAVWVAAESGDGPVMLAVKPLGQTWQTPQKVADLGRYPRLAVAASGIHILYGDYSALNYRYSADFGSTWTQPLAFTCSVADARLLADGDDVFAVYNDYGVPERSTIYLKRKHKDAPNWQETTLIYEKTSYKTTVYFIDFLKYQEHFHLSTTQESWYGGFSPYYYHESLDNGQHWGEDTPSGNNWQIDLDDHGDLYAAINTDGAEGTGLYLRKRVDGASWDAPQLIWKNPAGGLAGLRHTPKGLVVLLNGSNGQNSYRFSSDNGLSWSNTQELPASDNTIVADLKENNRIHLAVRANSGKYASLSSQNPWNEPWTPAQPTAVDAITIYTNRPGFLHWGVNQWQEPPLVYWPDGTEAWGDGSSVETPLFADPAGYYWVRIGPFDQTQKVMSEVNFVFHYDDDSWSAPNLVIPISYDLLPDVAISSPDDGAKVGGIVTVIAHAFDQVGISTVDVYVDQELIGSATTEPYQVKWDSSAYRPGSSHSIYAVATNKNGVSADSSPINVTIKVGPCGLVSGPCPLGATLGAWVLMGLGLLLARRWTNIGDGEL